MTPDPRLLLPATRALLEGWCGPVVVGESPERWLAFGDLSLGQRTQRTDVVLTDGSGTYWKPMGRVSLDLSRAECWMRVCWVLWRHVGVVSVDTYGQVPLVDSPSMTDDTHWVVTRRLRVGELVVHEERADVPGVLFALGDDAADPLLALAAVARHVLGGPDAR